MANSWTEELVEDNSMGYNPYYSNLDNMSCMDYCMDNTSSRIGTNRAIEVEDIPEDIPVWVGTSLLGDRFVSLLLLRTRAPNSLLPRSLRANGRGGCLDCACGTLRVGALSHLLVGK